MELNITNLLMQRETGKKTAYQFSEIIKKKAIDSIKDIRKAIIQDDIAQAVSLTRDNLAIIYQFNVAEAMALANQLLRVLSIKIADSHDESLKTEYQNSIKKILTAMPDDPAKKLLMARYGKS